MRVLGVDPGLTRCGVGVVDGGVGRALTLVENGAAGFHVWRLNRWTGTQELCVAATGQKGCSK